MADSSQILAIVVASSKEEDQAAAATLMDWLSPWAQGSRRLPPIHNFGQGLAGEHQDQQLAKLSMAQIFVLLISPDFLVEMGDENSLLYAACHGIEKRASAAPDLVYPVPVIWRPVDLRALDGEPLVRGRELIPTDELGQVFAMTRWEDLDQAFEKVAAGIQDLIDYLYPLS